MNKRIAKKIEKRNQRGKSFSIHSGSPKNAPRYSDKQVDNDEAIQMLVEEITLLGKEIQAFQQGIIDEHKQALAELENESNNNSIESKMNRLNDAIESAE